MKTIRPWQDRVRERLHPSIAPSLTDEELSIEGTKDMLSYIADLEAALKTQAATVKPWWADEQVLKYAELYRTLRKIPVILNPHDYKQVSGALLDFHLTQVVLKNSPDGALPWELPTNRAFKKDSA